MTTLTYEQSGYLSTLEDVASMIQKAQINMKKCPEQRLTEGYIKARLKTIEDYWDTFKSTHNSLTKCTPREQKGVMPYFLNEDFYKIEDLYLSIYADLTDLLLKLQPKPNTEDEASFSQEGHKTFAKLPRIQVPTFSGKYEDWPSYEDLFIALVHNSPLSDVQKLHYLKTSVSGEAALLLRNIHTTHSNYTLAWDLLRTRFGNKRVIANSILKRLFGQKKVSNQSASQIKALLDTTMECLSSLNNHLKIRTDSWDPVIVFLVSQKLDPESLKHWEEYAYKENSDEMPTWEEMKKFLQFKFRTLDLITTTASTLSREKQSPQQNHKSFHVTVEEGKIFRSVQDTTSKSKFCTYCYSSDHFIRNCKYFMEEPVDERHCFVRRSHLCFNCLIPNHRVFKCTKKKRCLICRRKHDTLIHRTDETKGEREKIEKARQEHKSLGVQYNPCVLLPTAQVRIRASNGEIHTFRALVDQGSEASFASARAVELLGLARNDVQGVASGMKEESSIGINHSVDLLIIPSFAEDKEFRVKAYVLNKISTTLPSKPIAMNQTRLKSIRLADPKCCTPGGIDILLGADVFSKIISDGIIMISEGLVAQRTSLGWIISGQGSFDYEEKK